MIRPTLIRQASLLAVAALALGACEGRSGSGVRAGGGLCSPFPGQGADVPAAPVAPAAAVDDCLHRWGYALAASEEDSASDVAQAAVAACSTALANWNQQALAPTGSGDAPSEAPSILTGEDTNPVSERYSYARSRALFYVVQARAGNCSAPPMTNGSPAANGAR